MGRTILTILFSFALFIGFQVLLEKKRQCNLKKRMGTCTNTKGCSVKTPISSVTNNNPTTFGELFNQLNINLEN